MTLKLFNTFTRRDEDFKPLNDREVRMYSCGPTVYDYPHIGNLRAFVFADTLYRWLRFGEDYTVKWVMNITDVDDKTIKRSQEEYPKLNPMEALIKFTRRYEEVFFQDLAAFNIERVSFIANPRATDYIAEMKKLILAIAEQGFAKVIEGSVFFDVQKYAAAKRYGCLVNLNLENLQHGTRTLADEIEKEHVQDFALWKAAKAGEPAWDFDFQGENLPGRPGWHIECSAMGEALLGLPFDIHTGGVDLAFPHHENEIAQAEAGWGVQTACFWCHNEHLMVEGAKMSKSLGNFYTLKDLETKGFTSEVIRFFFVSNHYQGKVNLSEESLRAAKNGLERLRNGLMIYAGGDLTLAEKKAAFVAAMRDNLNTPMAVAVLYDILKGAYIKEEVNDFFAWAEKVFGVRFLPRSIAIPSAVAQMAEARWQAKKNRNFAQADALRQDILAAGYEVRDADDYFEVLPLKK